MKTICPICGFEMEVEDKKIRKRGRNVTCPNCEHTYFVERSTYSDLVDRIEDSSSLDIVEEVRLAVEREQRGEEEEKPAVERGSSGENKSPERMGCLSVAIMLGVYGVVLISDNDVKCGIYCIIGAITSLLVTIFWKKILLYIWEGWTGKDSVDSPFNE